MRKDILNYVFSCEPAIDAADSQGLEASALCLTTASPPPHEDHLTDYGPFEVFAEDHRRRPSPPTPSTSVTFVPDAKCRPSTSSASIDSGLRLHRFRPGSDFLLQDFDHQQPVSSPTAPSNFDRRLRAGRHGRSPSPG